MKIVLLLILSILFAFSKAAFSEESVIFKHYSKKIVKRKFKALKKEGRDVYFKKGSASFDLYTVYLKTYDERKAKKELQKRGVKYRNYRTGLLVLKYYKNFKKDKTILQKKLHAFVNKVQKLKLGAVKYKGKKVKAEYQIVERVEQKIYEDGSEMSFGGSSEYSSSGKTYEQQQDSFVDFRKREIGFDLGNFNSRADSFLGSLNGNLHLDKELGNGFKASLGARIAHYSETNKEKYTNTVLNPNNTYIKYINEYFQITAGYQSVIWGKLDGVSPLDKICPYDLNRTLVLDQEQFTLSNALLRTEIYMGNHKLDVVATNKFTKSRLPKVGSNFYPINFQTGEIQGVPGNATLNTIVQNARIKEQDVDDNSVGVRYSLTGDILDFSLAYLSYIPLTPYAKVNENFLNAINGGTPTPIAIGMYYDELLVFEYPKQSLYGLDIALPVSNYIFRGEFALISDYLVTKRNFYSTKTDRIEWGVSTEYSLEDIEMRLNLQINGFINRTTEDIFEDDKGHSISGQVEYEFDNNNMSLKLRALFFVDNGDYFFSPEFSYKSSDSTKLSLGLRQFSGDKGTTFGYLDRNDYAYVGLRSNF